MKNDFGFEENRIYCPISGEVYKICQGEVVQRKKNYCSNWVKSIECGILFFFKEIWILFYKIYNVYDLAVTKFFKK